MVTLANRVKHTITAVASSGTGTLTLGEASTGIVFNPTNSKMYIPDLVSEKVYQYSVL